MPNHNALLALSAFFALALRTRLMNVTLFPLYDGVLMTARDLTVLAGVAVYLAVVAVMFYRPQLLKARLWTAASLVLTVLGFAGTMAVVAGFSASPVLLAVSSMAWYAGNSWVALLAMSSCCVLERRDLFVGIPLVMAAVQLVAWLLSLLPDPVGLAALLACPFAEVVLAGPIVKNGMASLRDIAPITDAVVVKPASYLPLGYPMFVCLFLFAVVSGMGLRIGTLAGAPNALLNMAVLLSFVVWNLLDARKGHFDLLFSISVTLVLGGLLTAPLIDFPGVAPILIAMSNSCYGLVFELVLITAAARNPRACLFVFAWGNAARSVGTILGANLGVFASMYNSGVAFLVSAALGMALVAYVLIGMRNFSFTAAIEGIEPDVPLVVPAVEQIDAVHEGCVALAARTAMTPREEQILELLAHGRNNAYIQEELGLTRNTVKTYIKHVYAKTDVHSQQELIDLVTSGES